MTIRNNEPPQGYCAFEVGQHVVCVDASLQLDNGQVVKHHELDCNRVYTVREVLFWTRGWVWLGGATSDEFGEPIIALRLHEITERQTIWGHPFNIDDVDCPFDASRFRPLPKLKVEDFMSAGEPVRQDASRRTGVSA